METTTTEATMYERTYGYLYDRDRTVKDDAANIRAHIRTMTKAGVLPAGWKYSVRYRTASMCVAIDVKATSPRPIYQEDPTARRIVPWQDNLTDEARAVQATLDELVEAHNHDGSDVLTDYFDVKFYGRAVVITAPGVPEWGPEQAVAS